ncbi:RND family transporter [Natrinema pallidum]|uniref:RND transporter n=1 Tax=Natrinema pallidum TaxID=69527 RepID=A0A4V1IEL9_9EURY|nr:MMPL family transporter [Natrinema pallidum]QCW01954.1 RND transporter [Natrinema pallidum]
MTRVGHWIDEAIAQSTALIVSRPRTIVIVFLLLTAFFAAGIPLVETETDLRERYSDGLDVKETQDDVEADFQGPFTAEDETTRLVHDGTDVLTREELLHVLRLLERIDDRPTLRMESADGPATMVAQALEPGADTPTEQRRAVERATETEIRQAVREVGSRRSFSRLVSEDFNRDGASASASITVISHDVPSAFDDEDMDGILTTIDTMAADEPADIRAFGSGIVDSELEDVISDSFVMVMPVVVTLLLGFLAVAYRDPFDLLLGLIALLMTMIWTFGFLGYAGIPFGQEMIIVPVLLLAVGVDFGIHIINRYREEKIRGDETVPAMRTATSQLSAAFFIVTATAVFGFGANVFAELEPMREMGLVASAGIIFTFVIFSGCLPAMKLQADRFRDRHDVREFNSTPIASEESLLGRLLAVSATVGKRAPLLMVVLLVLFGAGMGAYGTGVETTFEEEDFLPPEEEAWYVDSIPEPFAPGEYTATETLNLLEGRFAADQDQSITMYVEGPFEEDHALEALAAPDDDPPETLAVGPNGRAESRSIVSVIQSRADADPEFAALVARNDRDRNGIPDRNLDRIYDELFASPAGPAAERYLTPDRRAAQVEYTIESDATIDEIAADGADHADSFRYTATATGTPLIYNAITNSLFESSIQGMVLAIVLSAVFLVIVYGVLEGKPWIGLINVFPIMIAVSCLLGTMRLLDMPLNAVTGLLLSFAIGLGVDYAVHFMHRFVDEYTAHPETVSALTTTLSSTGGALTGSMLTTSIGTGALMLAITPVLGDFGLLIALSVFYSFAASIVALPPALVLWDRGVTSDATGTARLKALLGA